MKREIIDDTMNATDFLTPEAKPTFASMNIGLPDYKSVLIIGDSLNISLVRSAPNWWWRMWQYLLLGFRWKNV